MEFEKLIKTRRSVRKYDASKKVSEEQIKEIVKARTMAPSWKNGEPARYYIVSSPEKVAEFREKCLPDFNAKNSNGCSAYAVMTFVPKLSGFSAGEPTDSLGDKWGSYDLGLNNAYFILKASDLGLSTLIMGLRNEETIRKMLNIPQNEIVMSVLALGVRDGEPMFAKRKEVDDILKIY